MCNCFNNIAPFPFPNIGSQFATHWSVVAQAESCSMVKPGVGRTQFYFAVFFLPQQAQDTRWTMQWVTKVENLYFRCSSDLQATLPLAEWQKLKKTALATNENKIT